MEYISKSAVVAEIEDWRDKIKMGIFSIPLSGNERAYATFEYEVLGKVRYFIDNLEVKEVEEEPVSKDLEETAKEYAHHQGLNGAQWQKEQMEKVSDNIEKELDIYLTSNGIVAADIQFEPFTQLEKCARYFFNLGKNQRRIKI